MLEVNFILFRTGWTGQWGWRRPPPGSGWTWRELSCWRWLPQQQTLMSAAWHRSWECLLSTRGDRRSVHETHPDISYTVFQSLVTTSRHQRIEPIKSISSNISEESTVSHLCECWNSIKRRVEVRHVSSNIFVLSTSLKKNIFLSLLK